MENNLLILELEEEFQKIHEKINEDINSCEILYHYTDYSIFECKEISSINKAL